jgi:hypothetical protein
MNFQQIRLTYAYIENYIISWCKNIIMIRFNSLFIYVPTYQSESTYEVKTREETNKINTYEGQN